MQFRLPTSTRKLAGAETYIQVGGGPDTYSNEEASSRSFSQEMACKTNSQVELVRYEGTVPDNYSHEKAGPVAISPVPTRTVIRELVRTN